MSARIAWERVLFLLNFVALVAAMLFIWRMVPWMTETAWLRYPLQPVPVLITATDALPLEGDLATYRNGDAVHVLMTRCNDWPTERGYFVTRHLVNSATGKRYPMKSEGGVSVLPGCTTAANASSTLRDDLDLAPGIYHVEAVSEIAGTILSWSVTWKSGDFRLVND